MCQAHPFIMRHPGSPDDRVGNFAPTISATNYADWSGNAAAGLPLRRRDAGHAADLPAISKTDRIGECDNSVATRLARSQHAGDAAEYQPRRTYAIRRSPANSADS